MACADTHLSGKQQLNCYSCRGSHNANYRGCNNGNEAKAAAAKRAQREHSWSWLHLGQLPNRRHYAVARSTFSEGGHVVKAHATPQPPQHLAWADGLSGRLPSQVFHVSPLVLRCRWWNSNHPAPSVLTWHPLLQVSHLLKGQLTFLRIPKSLPTQTCIELTHCLLSMVSSLPTREAHPRVVLKTIFLFIGECDCVV
jgi:hypothetical protein